MDWATQLQEEKDFVLRCEKYLPKMLMVDGINYKLNAHRLLGGGFRITYGEYGKYYNWKNKLLDLFYIIVDVLPTKKEYKEGEIQDNTIYKTINDDIVFDCLEKLNNKLNKNRREKLERILK